MPTAATTLGVTASDAGEYLTGDCQANCDSARNQGGAQQETK
jgi:hypothetical protein